MKKIINILKNIEIEEGDKIFIYKEYIVVITKKGLMSGLNLIPLATWSFDEKIIYFDGFFWKKLSKKTKIEVIKHEISERKIFLKLGLTEENGIIAHKKAYRPVKFALIETFELLSKFDPLLTFEDFKNSYKDS